MAELIEVPRGLHGVAVTATTVGDVLGDEGYFHYRGRSAVELARTSTFEEVAAIVLDDSGAPAIGDGTLPASLAPLLDRFDLRTGLSALAEAIGTRALVDLGPEQRRVDAVQLISALPTLVAALHHGRVTPPRADLGHVANYLWMLTGVDPTPEAVRALETYLVLTIDHGFNASTFAARVIASTGTDLGGCLVGALAALSGPRHGASMAKVLDMLDGIAEADRAEVWMRDEIAARRRLMGFGHSVYRAPDPRCTLLSEVLAALSPERHALVAHVEQTGLRVLAGRRLVANVDLYAPVVLEACGVPRALFTATFAVGRVVGWCAHALEQCAEAKVIRPAAYYVGPPP
ncbi:MAG: citrate synthase/methylcitrate synthase [Acidimicrobiia bacterium]|nr:citrate synthase/methylcitrate synthase [Acidimicrobiia bacterium]